MSESKGLHASPSEWPRALFYVALLFSIYQIVTAAFHPVTSQVLRAGHVGFLLLLVFLCYPARGDGRPFQPLAWLLGLAGFGTFIYQWYFEADLIQRSGDLTPLDMAVGLTLIVLVFEAARRVMGIALPIICALFLGYGLFGGLGSLASILGLVISKRLGLRGLHRDELPNAWRVLKAGWLSVLPLIILIAVLLSGRTPFAAAFWSITACIAVLLWQELSAKGVVEGLKGTAHGLYEGFKLGAKQSLSVTAAAALVGVVIGVVTLTGVGFKISFIVTSTAAEMAGWVGALKKAELCSCWAAWRRW